MRRRAFRSSLSQDFLATLSGRVGIGTITCILTIAPLFILLLNLSMELPELNLATVRSLLTLGLRELVLQLLLLLHKLTILCFELFEMGLRHSQRIVYSRYLTLLLVQNANEIVLDLLLRLFEVFLHLALEVFLLLVKLFYSFIEYLDVQLELLLYFDVVAHLGLVLLQLLLVLLRWQVNRFEG